MTDRERYILAYIQEELSRHGEIFEYDICIWFDEAIAAYEGGAR